MRSIEPYKGIDSGNSGKDRKELCSQGTGNVVLPWAKIAGGSYGMNGLLEQTMDHEPVSSHLSSPVTAHVSSDVSSHVSSAAALCTSTIQRKREDVKYIEKRTSKQQQLLKNYQASLRNFDKACSSVEIFEIFISPVLTDHVSPLFSSISKMEGWIFGSGNYLLRVVYKNCAW